jgi:hypothetical protein
LMRRCIGKLVLVLAFVRIIMPIVGVVGAFRGAEPSE